MEFGANAPLPQLMKIPDVAIILNVSRSVAYRLVHTSEIVSVRFGRSVQVRPDDLQAFIQTKLNKDNA